MTETAVIPHTQCIEVKISHILRSSLVSPCYAINSRTCNRLALDLAEGWLLLFLHTLSFNI